MRNNTVLILLSLVCICTADFYGVDVSTLTSVSSFQCLKTQTPNAYVHVIIRAWTSSGAADTNVVQTALNAWQAKVSNVDVYFYPCYSCGNVATQVQNAVSYLSTNNVQYYRFWLDVEGTWSSPTSYTANQQFFTQMLTAAQNIAGLNIGIYSSKSQWSGLFGSTTWTGGAGGYPLWYAHYDGVTSFSDFSTNSIIGPFAGWTTPTMKQYQGTTSLCSASVDLNYATNYPVFSVLTSESNTASAREGAKVSKCDINRDGYLDLVATGVTSLFVYLGTASGTYSTTATNVILINSAPGNTVDGLGLDCVDVNEDGYADVLVGDWTVTPSYVRIFNGSASGISTTPATITYSTGSGHYFGAAITDGDFNNDGHRDIAVGAYGLGRVFIYYGLGTSGLNPTPSGPSVLYPNLLSYGQGMAVCDLSNDGYPDLLVCDRSYNSSTGQLHIHSNLAGTFQSAVLKVGAATSALYSYDTACGDINGDGNKDVIVLSQGDKLIYIYYGTGNIATLPTTANVILSTTDAARSISVADQNLDGYADILVGSWAVNKVKIWYGGPSLTSSSGPNFVYNGPSGSTGWSVTHLGNIDGIGRSEVAYGTYTYTNGETSEGLVGVLYNS